jgi:hypothetical protein
MYPVTGELFTESRDYMPTCYHIFGGTCEGDVKREPQWVSAINIEVSDNNTLQDTDKLRYILFGNEQ